MPRDFFSTKIRIAKTMQKADKPLILQHIAKQSGLTPQVTAYHLRQMEMWGIIGTVDSPDPKDDSKYYMLQPAYYDEKWLEALYAQLTPYIQTLAKQMDFSQCKVSPPKALLRNFTFILRLFEAEVEKLKLTLDDSNNF